MKYFVFDTPIEILSSDEVETKVKCKIGNGKIIFSSLCCSFCNKEINTQEFKYKFEKKYKFFCSEKCAIFSKLGEQK